MMEKEKGVRRAIRDFLLLQEAIAHSVAYLLAKNYERLISLLAEKS
jgi:hypothetical protein